MRRAIDTLGLKTAYQKQEIQKVLKIWMGLSFVPIDLMSEAIEIAIQKKMIFSSKNQVLEENIIRLRNNLINLEEFLNVSRFLINFKSV